MISEEAEDMMYSMRPTTSAGSKNKMTEEQCIEEAIR
jgi:hypothetical protein